jgi:DNA invertase Pin-like site-specific DNA recombinase
MHDPMMAAIGYTRVSTAEQAGHGVGLAAQRLAIETECGQRGWQLTGIVEDAGYSAGDLKRPGIAAVLEDLAAGTVHALVVAKLDRLSRSMIDFTSLMALAQKRGWAIVALDCAVDTTSPAGEAMANVMASFAQFERRLIGQRTRDALAIKRSQGVRLGRPPQIPLAVADRIRVQRDGGATLRAIAGVLNAEGVPTARGGTWQPATINRVLRRTL